MSEVLYTSDNFEVPTGYEKLDGIEVVKQRDGNIRYNGLIELGEDDQKTIRKLQLPDPLEMWGYDPEEAIADWETRKADPEKWYMKRQIEDLTSKVSLLVDRNKAIEAELSSLQEQIASSVSPSGVSVPGQTPETAAEELSTNGQEPTRLPEPTPTPQRESASAIRRGINRTTGRIGRALLRSQVVAINGHYNMSSRWGNRPADETYTEEEILEGYAPPERDAGAIALGGTALVGAGVLLGYLIWGRHGASPPEIISNTHTHKIYVPTGGNHINYLKPNGSSAVGLPQRLHVAKNFGGHEVIKNSMGQTVVSHSELPKGFQDRQGNLSMTARAVLRAKGYILTQTHVPKVGRYMTAVWTR